MKKTKPNDIRLQLFLAQAGVASRRKAEGLIQEGRVAVDGKVVDRLGSKVDPERQKVTVDGRQVAMAAEPVYYLFNKPRQVLSTLHDPRGRPGLKDYLDRAGIKERVFPVGRLDWDAEGLILMTNDGALAQVLQHPRFQVPKTYRVKVRGIPTLQSLERLKTGLPIPGGKEHRADVERIKTGADRTWLLITVWEGEKHQVKKMCEAVGHPVITIKREALGPLELGRLPHGEFRPLTAAEVAALKKLVPPALFT
ncbi:MAG: rRNA pseudouridine synthase [Deltaproteobacteria bacterium]|nr:rRNA pseudouridine synthase [Deltaproteobacteria bacterium]